MNRALGFSVAGILASIAVIAALLYAGGAWFGAMPAMIAPAGGTAKVVVFDRTLAIVAGGTPGTYLPSSFPDDRKSEVEDHCRAALRGEHRHFTCDIRGMRVAFDVSPVPNPAGVVLYGTLVAGAGTPVPAIAPRPAQTVA
jgi:hypothetical protein